MKIKTIAISICTIFPLLFSILSQAENISVAYHCPKIDEIDMVQDTRTIIHSKTVYWKRISNINLMTYDKPSEFIRAILKRNDTDSSDMSVSCIYRTEQNKELIIIPMASWHSYVDGVAKKILGNNWKIASDGNLECDKSITDCSFLF